MKPFIKHLNSILLKLTLIILIGGLMGKEVGAIALNGAYTINPSGIATNVNFKDITSAIAYLTGLPTTRPDLGPNNTSPFGVSGPVTFSIAPGIYNEQVTINFLYVSGISNINRVTFDGGNKNLTKITYFGNSGNPFTLKIQGVDFLTIQNLTIEYTNPNYGYGIHLTDFSSNNCDSIQIRNCNFQTLGYTNSINVAGIIANGAGSNINGLLIENSNFYGGYYGVNLRSNFTLTGSNNRILNNNFF